MSLHDDLRQDWGVPSIEDEAMLEQLSGDMRRAFCRFVRMYIVESFDEGTSEGEILGARKAGYYGAKGGAGAHG